jgi:serine/threonine protein kinase
MLDSNPPTSLRFEFAGQVIPSTHQAGVEYSLRELLGEGGMGSVYFAQRRSPQGSSAVALKIMRPDLVAAGGPEAELTIRKEAVALGRLNEQTPPTPHVVRMLDAGALHLQFHQRRVDVPWIALEYVSGGIEGTTLHDRVAYSRKMLGHALPPGRAATVIEHVGMGLEAVHREGVIHRDMKPGNVLCAGFGISEVFKISDFGIARPKGLDGTFGNVFLGTPGYVAPEQSFADLGDIGPWTDVFSFAALVFYVLTGESYFHAKNLAHALMLANGSERRRLTDCAGLSKELADQRSTCEELDRLLASATAADPKQRPPTALLLTQALLATLRRTSPAMQSMPPSTVAPKTAWEIREWTVVHNGEAGRSVRRAGWDGDGHCLALTSQGLEYWSGTGWQPCAGAIGFSAPALSVVAPVSAGVWVLAGSEGRSFVYRAGDAAEPLPEWNRDYSFTAAAGDPQDVAVFVAHRPGSTPVLVGMTARRWMRPMFLRGAGAISDITRISDTRFLVCGTHEDGHGFACIYDPLMWEHGELLEAPAGLVACSAKARDQGVCLGLAGGAFRVVDGHLVAAGPGHAVDFWTAGIDSAGVVWGGSLGSIWQQAAPGEPWRKSSEAPGYGTPFTSLFADVGRVVAMTRGGAVIEGRR